MRFRRICDSCGELVPCEHELRPELRCARCGGELAGPVAPVPETKEERSQVLASPLYSGVIAGRRGPIPSPW